MPSGPPLHFSDFHGGLNLLSAPELLEDSQARDMMNVQGTVMGAIVKRAGLRTAAIPPATLHSLVASETTPVNSLVAATDTSLVSVNAAGTVNTIQSGLTAGTRWEGLLGAPISGQGPLYLVNGVDAPQQWSGATLSTPAAAWVKTSGTVDVPNGKYSTQASNQMYIAGVAAYPNRVYVSALNNPTIWDPAVVPSSTPGGPADGGATSFDVDPNDGQVITAIGRVGPYVAVFKPRKTYVIINPGSIVSGDNLNIRRVSDSIGCISNRSVASGAAGTYFLSEGRGVYVTNGSTVTPMSDNILPLVTAAGTQAANAAGFYFSGHYYLSIASQGTAPNDLTLDYDEILKSWWKHSFGSNEFVAWHPSTLAQLYSAKSTAPVLDQCFTPNLTQDNGTNFTWVWKGPWQSPSFYRRRMYPSTWYRKRLRQIRIEGFGNVDYYLAKDFITVETLIRQNCFPGTLAGQTTFGGPGMFGGSGALGGIFGGGGPVGQADLFSLGVARAFSQVFSATSSTQDEVLAYTLALTDRVDRWD